MIVGCNTFFTVYQTRQALVVRLGQVVLSHRAGLNVKVPFIDSVIYIDKRILSVGSPAQEVIAPPGQFRCRAPVAEAARGDLRATMQSARFIKPSDRSASSQLSFCSIQRCSTCSAPPRCPMRCVTAADEITDARAISSIAIHRRSASISSTCVSAALICRSRTVRRSISA